MRSVSGNYKEAPTFEQLGIAHHLVLYETFLPNSSKDSAILNALTMDRGLVYLDSNLVGMTSRIREVYNVVLEKPSGKRLQILVENQGHLNFGNITEDWKVIRNTFLNYFISKSYVRLRDINFVCFLTGLAERKS